MKNIKSRLLFIALTLMLTAALPATAQASETEQVSETEDAFGTEQVSETEDASGTEQVFETEGTSETEQVSETDQTSEMAAEQEYTDVLSAYAVQISASLDGESVVITICGSTPVIDRLLVTLPGGDSQVLSSTDGAQFFLTTAADQQGELISYIPGTAGETGVAWYDALGGTFAIPAIETDQIETDQIETASASVKSSGSGKESSSAKTRKKSDVTEGTETTESSESAETTEISETTDSAEQTGTDDNTDTTEKTEEHKTKTSSGSGKSKSSGTNKGKSSSSTKGKNGSTETEESKTVTTAKSALGSFLLDSGRSLTYSPDEAPELAGMTYEATWEEKDGIRIYIYEEGGAILELSQKDSEKESAIESEEKTVAETEETALRFLLMQEGTDDESTARLWQQVLEFTFSYKN